MKTGLLPYRDIGATTMVTILITICVSKIHEKTLELSRHLGRKYIIKDDIEYAIISEWIDQNSCYNELRDYMNSAMLQGVVEVPEKYKDYVRLAWEEYNKLVVENIDCPEKLSKACSTVFLTGTIFDTNMSEQFEYSSADDENDEETNEYSYKNCECTNCTNVTNKLPYFYNLDATTLEHIDRMMFTTFCELVK